MTQTELLIIGDVHGKWQSYRNILDTHEYDRSIQLGDFGWGFAGQETEIMQRNVAALHESMNNGKVNQYFRGNHDNPGMCRDHEHCLPDVHYEEDTGIMTIAGADSIDKEWRTLGMDWWDDEELTYDELHRAIDLYEEKKPQIVITHEGPESIIPRMFSHYRAEFPSRTRQALDSMFAIHQPVLWVFGHWHTSKTITHNNTQFVCLNELETMKVGIL